MFTEEQKENLKQKAVEIVKSLKGFTLKEISEVTYQIRNLLQEQKSTL